MTRVAVDVYGSLSLTGKGHHTDIAIIMGLAGNQPDTVDIDAIPAFIRDVEARGRLLLANGQHEVDFPADDGMRFRSDNLPLHENGMTIHAWAGEKEIYCKTYYSIGGGFIVDEEHFGKENANELQVPYPFKSAQEMLAYCKETGLSLSGMVMQNELALHSKKRSRIISPTSGRPCAPVSTADEHRGRAAWLAARTASRLGAASSAGGQR